MVLHLQASSKYRRRMESDRKRTKKMGIQGYRPPFHRLQFANPQEASANSEMAPLQTLLA